MKKIETRGKMPKITLVLLLICLMFLGCEATGGNVEEIEPTLVTDKPETDIREQNDREIHNEVIEDNSEIAEMITYDYYDNGNYSCLYIAGLKIFEEFSTKEFGYTNEGNVKVRHDENVLEFYITTHTGLVPATGSITGPEVYFKINLGINEVIEKEFIPAPNYAEAAELYPEQINPDSIQYSEKVLELSDERLIEIGLYFKEYIIEIEKSKKEHSTDI